MTIYLTTYLKFTNEAQAIDLMPYAFDPELQPPAGLTIDVVGIIHKPTGEMITSEEGDFPAMAPIPGYHVNVRGPVPEELEPYITYPVTPSRVFL